MASSGYGCAYGGDGAHVCGDDHGCDGEQHHQQIQMLELMQLLRLGEQQREQQLQVQEQRRQEQRWTCLKGIHPGRERP